jgi:hypothetical protein
LVKQRSETFYHILKVGDFAERIVSKASHYIYSSASTYVNDRGIIEITKLDNPVIDVLKKAAIANIYNW